MDLSKVHQIWLGGDMPLQEQQWTEGVKRGALDAGLDYKLWRDADIQAAFGDEPGWKFSKSCWRWRRASRCSRS